MVEPGEIHEHAAAYVLDALDEDDERGFEEHVGRCTVCAEELDSLRSAAAALAFAAEAPPPPAELRARLLARAHSEAPANVVSLRRRVAVPALAAIAAAAAIALAVWAAGLSSSLDRERSARRDEARVISVLTSAGAARYPLAGARGELVVAPAGEAVLVVSGLATAPAGKTYEAWVVSGGEPQPAGLFPGGDRRSLVALTRRVPPGAQVAVSIERAGGVERLTGSPVFGARTA